MTEVFVAGATGYLGRHVVRALHAAGYGVRALVRDPERLGDLRALCSSIFVGEATRPETMRGAIGDARIVVSSLGKRDLKRHPTTREVDRDANLHLLSLARDANVEHFLFVSVLHGEQLRSAGSQVAAAREAVVDELRSSPLSWTVLRPTGFFNDMDELFQMAKRGRGWLIGDGSFEINPIHGADLAAVIVRHLADPASRNRAFDLGGPDVLTQRAILELAFSALGRPARLSRLPPGVLIAASAVVRVFSPPAADLIRSLARLAKFGAVAPPTGTHHLADHFVELAARADRG